MSSRSPGPARKPALSPGALEKLCDADIVAMCADGDARAWRTLVDRYRRLIYTIPYRMGLDASDADEVFQITFTRLAERIGKLKDPARVRAWLVTTARRVALNLITRAKDGDPDALTRIPDPAELPSDEVERLQDQQLVRVALARLGERCRGLLTLLYYSEQRTGESASYEKVAEELEMPIGSVGPTRIRCLKKLLDGFRELSEEGGE